MHYADFIRADKSLRNHEPNNVHLIFGDAHRARTCTSLATHVPTFEKLNRELLGAHQLNGHSLDERRLTGLNSKLGSLAWHGRHFHLTRASAHAAPTQVAHARTANSSPCPTTITVASSRSVTRASIGNHAVPSTFTFESAARHYRS